MQNKTFVILRFLYYEWLDCQYNPLKITVNSSLFQILTELEYSGVGRNKEQAARLLGHLVSNAARLIRPYMEPILKVYKFLNTVQ